MQIQQNKADGTIGKYVQDVHDICVCFTSLKLLNVIETREQQAAVFVFQCINSLAPDVFTKINNNLDTHNYGTRHIDNIIGDLRHDTQSSFSTKQLSPSVWNIRM